MVSLMLLLVLVFIAAVIAYISAVGGV